MKKYILAFILLLLTIFALASPSQGGEAKIGYIDSKRIFDEYKGKDELAQKMQKELDSWQNEAIKRKQEVQNLIKEFDSQFLMLSEEARERKRRVIEQKQREYEDFVQRIWGPDGEAQKQNEKIMKPFIDKVNSILRKIGEDGDYAIIFDVASTGVVYAKEGMDLSSQVIAELNQEYAPTVAAKEKANFCVFKFKELTAEARDYGHGTQVAQVLKAGLIKTGKFEESKKLPDALREANIGKKEEDFTQEEAARVGKLAMAKLVVIGEVTRVGDKVDITCKVVNPNTSEIIAQEIGSSVSGEREDIINMVGEVLSKLVPKISLM
ncbi:MAG: OmpH family outer membrane protein [bacterium]|nr:OmpH family outer membrane protein [bacterium]